MSRRESKCIMVKLGRSGINCNRPLANALLLIAGQRVIFYAINHIKAKVNTSRAFSYNMATSYINVNIIVITKVIMISVYL